jgi:hypothetical protein
MHHAMKLRPIPLGVAAGILWGVTVMLLTWWLLAIGSPGTEIDALKAFYFGYTYSFGGGFVALLWGFVDGFVGGALLAMLYNAFLKIGARSAATGGEAESA